MSHLNDTQEDLLEYLESVIAQPVVEQGVPDTTSVRRNPNTGQIDPYVAIQFGDIQQGRGRSMAGPRGDDYQLPVYIMCVAGSARNARRLYNKVMDVFLGEGFIWAGQVRKRSGGAMFVMTNSNSGAEAYVYPASFGLLIQFDS